MKMNQDQDQKESKNETENFIENSLVDILSNFTDSEKWINFTQKYSKDFQDKFTAILKKDLMGEKIDNENDENIENDENNVNYENHTLDLLLEIYQKTKEEKRKNKEKRIKIKNTIENLSEENKKQFWAKYYNIPTQFETDFKLKGIEGKIDEILMETQILRSKFKTNS